MKSPDQQIYDELFKISLKLGYDTYNYLPPEGTEYPFVFIGEQISTDTVNKTMVTGEVMQRIHVYGDKDKRRRVTNMMNNLIYQIRKITHTDTFYISIKSLRKQILLDTSTNETLLHGLIEIDFKFN